MPRYIRANATNGGTASARVQQVTRNQVAAEARGKHQREPAVDGDRGGGVCTYLVRLYVLLHFYRGIKIRKIQAFYSSSFNVGHMEVRRLNSLRTATFSIGGISCIPYSFASTKSDAKVNRPFTSRCEMAFHPLPLNPIKGTIVCRDSELPSFLNLVTTAKVNSLSAQCCKGSVSASIPAN